MRHILNSDDIKEINDTKVNVLVASSHGKGEHKAIYFLWYRGTQTWVVFDHGREVGEHSTVEGAVEQYNSI